MRLRLLLVCAISCLASVWFAPAALAFGDCGDAAYMQTFDDRLRAGSCDVIGVVDIRWSGGSAHMRLIKEHSSTIGSAAALMEQVRELAGRVGSAMDQIGGLSIPDVTVLLTDLMPPAREDAHADIQRTPKLERECAVAFYKSRTGMSRDQFVFTYAHELFHCIQFKMFLAKMVGHSDNWWTEGTAEYFAYLARPGYSGDDSFISQFDAESDAQSLHTMEYETIAFFAWCSA